MALAAPWSTAPETNIAAKFSARSNLFFTLNNIHDSLILSFKEQ
jgi:hypothetical protein